MEQQDRIISNTTQAGQRNCIFLLLFLTMIFSFPQLTLGQVPKQKSFTVVIDAGHGGKDPGAVGKKSYEKNVALAIAKKVGYYIESLLPDVNVIYTRKTDVFVDLYVRADIANKANADLFMSIHVDGFGSSNAWGTSTYVMGATKNESNLALVMKENQVIELEEGYKEKYEGFDPNDPASYIKFSVMQDAFLDQSLDYASKVQDQFRTRAKRRDRGVHSGPLVVLSMTTMPSVLIETGFITNLKEEDFLNTVNGQDLVASSIFRAFKDFKLETENKTVSGVVSDNKKIIASKIPVSETVIDNTNSTIDKTPPVVEKETPLLAKKETTTEIEKSLVSYRVQVLASRNQILPGNAAFKGQSEFIEFREGEYYKYLSKPTSKFADCQKLRNLLAKTFPGAFVVAFQNGNKIPLERAKKLEGSH